MKKKPGIYEKYIKRMQDFILALMMLVILSPIIVIISLLIYIKLGKPIIFKQERPGLNGKSFYMYKFRSMTNEVDENGQLLPDENRLDPFGKKLRSTSLDELPSLINVLRNEMSLVGPRPLLVKYLPRYTKRQCRRHEVLPGITGLAQVNGRNAISWEEKFEYDIQYVENVSFVMDWSILFRTVVQVFKRDGITSDSSITMEEFMGTENKE